jgi:hypothetical protein
MTVLTTQQVKDLTQERHPLAHTDAMAWRPRKRRTSLLPILLTIAAAAVAGYFVRSNIDQPHPRLVTVDRPERRPAARPAAPPQREATATRCSDPDGTIHGWTGNGTGITPHDYLHFLPPCDGRR